tara:strand:- start:214 stop:981 length:768 start_codon:yes stop_codon:yes gene_type:complete
MGKYFSVTKKMPVAASLQHAAFGAGDVLVDWTAIEIPKGAACLQSLTMLVRPKGDATPTDNNFACDIVFSTTNTQSLGTVNGPVNHAPFPDMIGLIEITTGHYGVNVFNSTVIATTNNNGDGNESGTPIVLTPDPTAGDSPVGFDTIYVGIVANGAFDFTSINAIAEAGAAGAASTQVITMDGSGMDVREHFAAGDVVHIGTSAGTPAADSLIGTVASADSATQITLTDTSATELVDGDILYNLHPITLVLGFEK